MSHFIFRDEHKMFRQTVRKFLENELLPRVVEWESIGEIPKSFFQQLFEMGYIGIHFPEEYGGNNADLITEAVFLEELGKYGTGGISSAVVYHLTSLYLIFLYGSDEQKDKYLRSAIRGEKRTTFAAEPFSKARKVNNEIETTREGDYYILNGSKKFVTSGVSADFICVTAITDPQKGSDGISLFIIDRESPGFSVDRTIKKLGWRATDTADLLFHDVKVPKSALIGSENQGNTYWKKSKQWLHVMFALLSAGLAQQSLADTIKYSKERRQFGKTINQFQVLQHKMAEMAVELEKSRSLTYRAVYLLNAGQDAEVESAMAKTFSGEMVKQVTDSAIQIHGGMGYMMETPVQRYWRDARAMSIIEETTQDMNEYLINLLGIPSKQTI